MIVNVKHKFKIMKKLLLFVAVMALGCFWGFSQEINLDDALEADVYTSPTPSKVNRPIPVPDPPATVSTVPAKQVVSNATVTEETIKVQTVDYSRLSADQRAKLSSFAKKASYGSLVKADLTDCNITSVTKVTNVPSRSGRKMTQYVVIYIDKNGQKEGIITTDNPLVNGGCTPCYIKCMVATPGYHQGDDNDIPKKPKTGENHQISQDWWPVLHGKKGSLYLRELFP